MFEMFEAERTVLMEYRGAFDGFHATAAAVSKTCLVRFDRNKYSVKASAVGRPVDIHAYADRIVIKQDGIVVGEHARKFGRAQPIGSAGFVTSPSVEHYGSHRLQKALCKQSTRRIPPARRYF